MLFKLRQLYPIVLSSVLCALFFLSPCDAYAQIKLSSCEASTVRVPFAGAFCCKTADMKACKASTQAELMKLFTQSCQSDTDWRNCFTPGYTCNLNSVGFDPGKIVCGKCDDADPCLPHTYGCCSLINASYTCYRGCKPPAQPSATPRVVY